MSLVGIGRIGVLLDAEEKLRRYQHGGERQLDPLLHGLTFGLGEVDELVWVLVVVVQLLAAVRPFAVTIPGGAKAAADLPRLATHGREGSLTHLAGGVAEDRRQAQPVEPAQRGEAAHLQQRRVDVDELDETRRRRSRRAHAGARDHERDAQRVVEEEIGAGERSVPSGGRRRIAGQDHDHVLGDPAAVEGGQNDADLSVERGHAHVLRRGQRLPIGIGKPARTCRAAGAGQRLERSGRDRGQVGGAGRRCGSHDRRR